MSNEHHVDFDRENRTGFPEIIYGEGKTSTQIINIIHELLPRHHKALITRIDETKATEVLHHIPEGRYNVAARTLVYGQCDPIELGHVLVVSAGTSDVPVREEAVETGQWLGCRVETMTDVGVAGIDRLLSQKETLQNASIVIVIAGMEGALSSVVAGLVKRPVLAVPTSVGYGANLEGITPLLAMVSSCASGMSVVNINNGFGAMYQAAQILKLAADLSEER
ncbi:nickel pincer cofactor biosynthesis protein LarB [Geomicrobium sediminis]|uniref:NCAIR mutase (PurE)-related protein n=1 Tax=Geomicrobium sediminis TaxID=1347788 RepID=A0ABS2PAC2_9BACL|nr:nickel pincer cofactor biosynthesis protein LarB [Geomicrobium sediminis]MBM7632306.1 NCAIR mutase (PurE)-related protein [Geomicrobium sediminis]